MKYQIIRESIEDGIVFGDEMHNSEILIPYTIARSAFGGFCIGNGRKS